MRLQGPRQASLYQHHQISSQQLIFIGSLAPELPSATQVLRQAVGAPAGFGSCHTLFPLVMRPEDSDG